MATVNKKKSLKNRSPKRLTNGDKLTKEEINGDQFEAELLETLISVKNGKFAARMSHNETGVRGKICDALNEIIEFNEKMVSEFTKAGKTIGKEGKLNESITISNAKG